MAANQNVRMRRERLAACMTCPICNRLLREATTISECLHTFCRKCINKKLSDEKLKCCPVCNADLGCKPLEMLRPDHILQDLRAKLFPTRKEEVNAPEVGTPVMLAETATNVNGLEVIARKVFVAAEAEKGTEATPAPDCREQEKMDAPGESGISPRTILDAATARGERTGPIWFSLLASEDQNGQPSLPQIPASYLRIKNGNVPVSFIQKYLTKKLDLSSEDEVELRFLGEPLLPTLELTTLVNMWLQYAPILTTSVGSSAEEAVMVLTYSRHVSVQPDI